MNCLENTSGKLKPFDLFVSSCTQNAKNTDFRHKVTIDSPGKLAEVVRFDFIAALCKNFHRHAGNFIECNCLYVDVDNDLFDNDNDWRWPEDIAQKLNDVNFYIYYSRHHMKGKIKPNGTKESPRPKFHVLFPLSKKIKRLEEYTKYQSLLRDKFKYHGKDIFDDSVKNPVSLSFGVEKPEVEVFLGRLCLDEFLDQDSGTFQEWPDFYIDQNKNNDLKKEIDQFSINVNSNITEKDIKEALSYIDPVPLLYGTWLYIGTFLQVHGFPLEVWKAWSMGDPARYNKHPNDFTQKHYEGLNKSPSYKHNDDAFWHLAVKGGYKLPEYIKSNTMPKKWKRPEFADNDTEIVAEYKEKIKSLDLTKGLAPLFDNDMWWQLLVNASKCALNMVLSYTRENIKSHSRKDFDNYYSSIFSRFEHSKHEEWLASLTDDQRKQNDKRVEEQKAKEFPVLNKNGKPKTKSEENLRHFFKLFGYEVKYNVITRLTHVYQNGKYSKEYSGDMNKFYAKIMSQGAPLDYDINKDTLDDVLRLVTEDFNPLTSFFESSYDQWDKKEGHCRDLFNCFILDNCDSAQEQLLYKWFLKWLVQAVKISYNSGSEKDDIDPQTMLVLQGSKQAQGKSTWGEKLLPAELVKREMTLDLSKNNKKDSVYQCTSAGLTELAEFARSASYVDGLKSFLTTKLDVMRRPYDRKEVYLPRRTSFYGTVNDSKFLLDTTGNRRYIVIPIADIEREHLNSIDMCQVWGEVYWHAKVKQDIDIRVTTEEAAGVSSLNERFRSKGDIEQALDDICDFSGETQTQWYTATAVSKRMYNNMIKTPAEIGKVLSQWTKSEKIKSRIIHHKTEYALPITSIDGIVVLDK